MPLFPVTRAGVMLLGQVAPASVVVNNGPGVLYLYRNSAVSAAAYDSIVGPSGSFQWPGGELWAASDATAQVNVLAGLSSYDSGTQTVSGSVSLGINAPLSQPVPKNFDINNNGAATSRVVTFPANVIGGDVLIGCAAGYGTGDAVFRTSGLGTDFPEASYFDSNTNQNVYLFAQILKTAQAGQQWSFISNQNRQGWTTWWYHLTNVITTLNSTGVVTGKSINSGITDSMLFDNFVGKRLCLLGLQNGGSSASMYSPPIWATPNNGGPPAAQPQWRNDARNLAGQMNFCLVDGPGYALSGTYQSKGGTTALATMTVGA